ncbi:related to PFA4 - Palmitoyltransferase [Pseudozyma flocculosa]|uniref:Palmitoyltransferase PFA4 n=1 Tax=Pseudozyma flocculosa TaxID=84751 RepID=A0A5C3F5D5_9BASI|nr:related to PFA4 - Palmitoyltransferase [Pseudozyma flocculosa]
MTITEPAASSGLGGANHAAQPQHGSPQAAQEPSGHLQRPAWSERSAYRDEQDSQSEGDGAEDQEQPLLEHDQLASSLKGAAPSTLNGRRKPLKWSEVLWVTGTLLLICFLVYTSQLFIILPYYRNTVTFTLRQLLALLVPFNLCSLAIFYNYYLCVVTNPGDVPSGWQPDWTALDPAPQGQIGDGRAGSAATMELKSYIHRPRYCKGCRAFKPPRSHHCKTCGKCVLRMDHHCPWVANCVGFHNHGHFIRFLAAVDVTCTFHLVMLSMRVLDRWNRFGYWREPTTREMLCLVANYALCIPVLLMVGMFSAYHFYCIAINQTTIESWEKDKVATLIRRGKIRKVRYPYSVSLLANVKSVLGPSPLLWCLPQRMRGDGLVYDVAEGIGECRLGSHRRGCGQRSGAESESDGGRDGEEGVELGCINPEVEAIAMARLRHLSFTTAARNRPQGKEREGEGGRGETHPGAQYRWPPRDPSRLAPSSRAPPLFPSFRSERTNDVHVDDGGASRGAGSPWTYGNGFNPSLVPSNSALRYRGASSVQVSSRYPGEADEGEGEDEESSISSGSDDDDDDDDDAVGYRRRAAAGGRGGWSQDLASWHDDDDDEEGEEVVGGQGAGGRVRVRRGSEGYEVRPSVSRWVVDDDPPSSDEASPVLIAQGQEQRQGRYNVALPSQVLRDRRG